MLFNSGVFLQFFAAFLLFYWLVRNHLRARNVLIVAASYLFYGWWDWRFLGLLLFSSTFDYCVGLGLERLTHPRQRRALLAGSVLVNLGILSFFKYGNFFVESMAALLSRLHVPFHTSTLAIILPVGISFYTFQSMSYALDVYRRQLKPTRNFVNFLAYVSFFPQLVAGPIQRAGHLLPQFERTVVITRAMLEEGVWLMLWGMFKKVALADNLAPLADLVYSHTAFNGAAVVLGTLAFGFQIYCDFSGYSDLARGLARVLGFDILWNFNLPYSATQLREFWRRWHIGLSTWLRDYLYISLGGNRLGPRRTYANLILTMGLGGLWHGAAWNFVLWGLWHGAGLAVERACTRGRQDAPETPGPSPELAERPSPHPRPPSEPDLAGPAPQRAADDRPARPAAGSLSWVRWGFTMLFVFYGWLLFRARSWSQIVAMTRALADVSLPAWTMSFLLNLAVFTLPLLVMEAWQLRARNRLAPLSAPAAARLCLQGALLASTILFWEKKQSTFIYFQF